MACLVMPCSKAPWRLAAVLAALVALAGLPALSRASSVAEGGASPASIRIRFASGRVMAAMSADPVAGNALHLRVALPGGGSIIVPAAEVRRIEEVIALAPPPVPPSVGPSTCKLASAPSVVQWDDLILEAAQRHGVDVNLVRAVIAVESAGDPAAVSRKGAVGLMQLLPRTAADYGCRELTDPASNIDAGCRHLARLWSKLDGEVDLVLAAYNAGEGVIERVGGIPKYPETIRYVRTVLDCLGS